MTTHALARRAAALTLVALAPLAAAACGGDDDDEASAETTEAESSETTETTGRLPRKAARGVDASDPDEAAVAEAWTTVFDSSVAADAKAPFLEDPAAAAPTLAAYATTGQMMQGITLAPTDVTVDGDTATVTYDILFAGTAGLRGPDRRGREPRRRVEGHDRAVLLVHGHGPHALRLTRPLICRPARHGRPPWRAHAPACILDPRAGEPDEDEPKCHNRNTSAETTRGPVSPLVRAWTWLVALGGAALVAVAAAEIVDGEGDGGASWLLLAGGILAVGPIVFDRLTRVSVGPAGLRFDLSLEIADLGAQDTAVRIDRWGGGLAEAARLVRQRPHRPGGRGRAGRPHPPAGPLRRGGRRQRPGAAVRRRRGPAAVPRGPPVVRVLVLGLMLGDPSLADVETIVSAITDSRTANEQYQGLRLAERVGRRLPRDDRRRLRKAIEGEPIPAGHARTQLRASVLVMLAARRGDDDRRARQPDPAPRRRPGAAGAARRRGRDEEEPVAS